MTKLTSLERKVLDSIDGKGLLDGIFQLVAIESVGGAETPAQQWVAELMEKIGLKVECWDLDFDALAEHPGHSTEIDRSHGVGVVGQIGKGSREDGLIYNGHVDVVPAGHIERWSSPPFEPRVREGKIYGRGAVDMKAGLCSAIFAAKAIKDAGVILSTPLMIESVIGEEDGGIGTLAAIVRGYKARGALVMEPTGLAVVTTGAGCQNFRIRVAGKAAHGALRGEGVSAIQKSFLILSALDSFEKKRNEGGHPSIPGDLPFPICVGKITGGEWASSVSEGVLLEGRYGIRPGEELMKAREEFEDVLERAALDDGWLSIHKPEIEWWGGRFEAASVDPNVGIAATVIESHKTVTETEPMVTGVPYGSDMGLLVNHGGTPAVLYGPGNVRDAHRPDEFVPIEEVLIATSTLALNAMRFCGVE
ncbi:MAG: ArgE/DapE family deacylase [Longimicrobiales bacterium]